MDDEHTDAPTFDCGALYCHDGRGGGCGRPWRACVCGDRVTDGAALDRETAHDLVAAREPLTAALARIAGRRL